MSTWYHAKFLQDHPPFTANQPIYVSQVGAAFDVCDRHGANLTRLSATDAARLLKSERDANGYSIRVEDVEALEARIALESRVGQDGVAETVPHSPGLHATVRFMSGVELAEMGLPVHTVARKIVGWRCFDANCGAEFKWQAQPAVCPMCGCALFEAIYA